MARTGRPRYRRGTFTTFLPPAGADEPAWRAWHRIAGRDIRRAGISRFHGPVAITIRAAVPDTPRDLSEIVAALLATLAASSVISDRTKPVRVVAEWSVEVGKDRVEVEVRQVSTPEARQRISVAARQREAARELGV